MKPHTQNLCAYLYCFFRSTACIAFLVFFLVSCRKNDFTTIDDEQAQEQDGKISARRTETATGPNIILILADDIGFEIPTANGGNTYETPNIDLMAQNGMLFTQCHAAPLCSPSRVMLLTGKYNFRNYTRWGLLDRTNKTVVNMLHDSGYKTLLTGKWQLDGGDTSITTFGFDDYLVWAPFTPYGSSENSGKGSRYKSPTLYQNAGYIPQTETNNLYSEDLFTNKIKDFIDSNLTTPFFVYYPMCIGHFPFLPTPDDAEYLQWSTSNNASNKQFFPSMVKYMDKKVGEIVTKVQDAGIAENTIIIFMGDNGTNKDITSYLNNKKYKGGKSTPKESGTRVPLIVYWPGTVAVGIVNDDLIDLTDFLPTLADVSGLPQPIDYGIIDGVSFYPRLIGQPGTPREWTFCHFDPQQAVGGISLTRWAQNKTFKLFDSTGNFYAPTDNFYNCQIDPDNKTPLFNLGLNQQMNKDQLQAVLEMMHN